MIKSIYTIGKVLAKQKDYEDYFNPWANPFPKGEATVIVAEVENGQLLGELQLEKFSSSKVNKYLFREAKANATNLVPTFYLQAQSDPDKQSDSIRKMIKKAKASIVNYQHNFISKDQCDRIEQKLLALTLRQGTNHLFTMRINGKYFGDYEEFKDLFLKDAYQKYFKDSSSNSKVCAITYQAAKEVWGRIDTLGFTVNDAAFSRNGFNANDSYKMFPVSPEAVKILEGSRRIIMDNLSKNFFGLKYFVLPHFINHDEVIIESVMDGFIRQPVEPKATLDIQANSIINNENIIEEILKTEKLHKNNIYYDVFFYQINNAQFLIKLHLSDILPSRFRKIRDAKRNVENFYSLITTIHIPGKGKAEDKSIPFFITFSNIKDYFSKRVKTDTIFHPFFFKILEAVFYGNSLNEHQVLVSFTDQVSASYKNRIENPYQFTNDVKHTFVIYQFLFQMNLFKNKPISPMENLNPGTITLTLEDFEKQHPLFFVIPIQKAAFYLGCMTEKLLEKQRYHLKSEPFSKYLNGLKIDEAQLKKIHLKLADKIRQYKDKFYKSEHEYIEQLNATINPTLIENSNTSKTDISYAFATGMVMQKEFTKEKRKRQNSQKKGTSTI